LKKNNKLMRLDKKTKKMIDDFAPDEWHLLGARTTPPFLLWLKMLSLGGDEMKEIYGTTVTGAVIYKKPFTKFYFLSSAFKKVIESATEILFSSKKAKDQLAQVVVFQDYVKKQAAFFLEEDLKKLTNGELWKKYEEVLAHYTKPLLYGFLTWCTPVFTDYAKSILKKHYHKISHFNMDEKTVFGILVSPYEESPYTIKDKALDRLAIKYKRQIGSLDLNKKEISEKYPELNLNILSFLDKYKWLGYDYSGPVTTYGEVLEDIKKRQANDQHTNQRNVSRNDIIEGCGFDSSEKNIFDIFSQLTYVKDVRNSGDDFVHFCLIEHLFAEIGRRSGLSKEDIQFLSPEELEGLLNENKIYSKKYLDEKIKCYVATTVNKEGIKKYYVGNEAKKFLTALENKFDNSDVKKLKGTVACIGKVTAKVKIVSTFEELDKIKEGDILVTHMTSPRFMTAVRKVSAIITNEGGVTSHAAIISREFNIPCIVGTKNATRILHDGDWVEVDADKGIVRIIKKAGDE